MTLVENKMDIMDSTLPEHVTGVEMGQIEEVSRPYGLGNSIHLQSTGGPARRSPGNARVHVCCSAKIIETGLVFGPSSSFILKPLALGT